MSVINQVLTDLEKRGATSLSGETAIRVVPVRRQRRVLWLAAAGVVLGLVAASLRWNAQQQPEVPPNLQLVPSMSITVAPVEASITPVAAEEAQASSDQAEVSTMRLSYQLSAIPLPAAARPAPIQKAMPVAEEKIKEPVAVVAQTGNVDKQMKQLSPQQRAENEFRRAAGLVQKGRSYEALDVYRAVLKLDAAHDAARQAMAWILLENKRNADAERVLQEGLEINPKNGGFAMLLARLQVERNDLPLAMETLQKTLPYADQQADYHAFVAALHQRMNRHKEAITHYQIAVQLAPNSGIWLMGLGISLQAVQRNEDARYMFKRAIESHTLSAELQAFVEQRLKELG